MPMDPDFTKGSARERPFSPAPDRSFMLWLVALLLIISLMYVGYQHNDWWSRSPASATSASPQNPTPPSTHSTSTQSPTQQQSGLQAPESGTRIVTKCVVNGKTSYSDGTCAADALKTQIVTKANHNLMAAVRVPVVTQVPAPVPQLSAVAQSEQGSDYAAMKAECAALDDYIKSLDAQARRPQSGQMQDWIRIERSNARDRQFRIHCQ